MLEAWSSTSIPREKRKLWKSIPDCNFWETRKLQNHITFKNDELNVQIRKVAVISRVRACKGFLEGEVPMSFVDFIKWTGSRN